MRDPLEAFGDRGVCTVEPASDPRRNGKGEGPVFRPHLISKRMSDVQPESVRWLWPGRIPYGKMTLIAGDPGLGKSFLSLDLAARLSRGQAWPDDRDTPIEPGNVVILSAEDGIADTISPRLHAAGADVNRITAITGVRRTRDGDERYFTLESDLAALERHIEST